MFHADSIYRAVRRIPAPTKAWGADLAAGVTAAAIVALTAFSMPANAQLATEGWQWTQNANLGKQVTEQINTVSNLKDTILRQIEQYQQMLKAGARLATADSKAAEEIKRLTQAKKAFEDLYGDVTSYNRVVEARYVEASTKGLSWDAYLRAESDAIAAGNRRAIERVKQEQRMITAIQEDQALASEWAGKISGTQGVHESMGLLNVQLNRYLQQQARVTQLLAQAQGTDKAVLEAEKARNAANARTIENKMNNHHYNSYLGMMAGINEITGQGRSDYMNNTFRSGYTPPPSSGSGK